MNWPVEGSGSRPLRVSPSAVHAIGGGASLSFDGSAPDDDAGGAADDAPAGIATSSPSGAAFAPVAPTAIDDAATQTTPIVREKDRRATNAY
jgi:hypothetical protein